MKSTVMTTTQKYHGQSQKVIKTRYGNHLAHIKWGRSQKSSEAHSCVELKSFRILKIVEISQRMGKVIT